MMKLQNWWRSNMILRQLGYREVRQAQHTASALIIAVRLPRGTASAAMYHIATEITIVILLQTGVDYFVGALGIYQSQSLTTRQKLDIALACLAVPLLTFLYELFFSQSWIVILVLLFYWYRNLIVHFTVNPHLRFLGAFAILEEELWQYLCNAIMPLVVSGAYAKRAMQLAEQSFRTQSNVILCGYLHSSIPIKDVNLIVCEYCTCTPKVRKLNRHRRQILARES